MSSKVITKTPLVVLATGIAVHLKRFERDPAINAEPASLLHHPNPTARPYGSTAARRTKSGVALNYRPFGAHHDLDRETAQRYLNWLDAGNVGTHLDMEKANS